MRSSMHCRRFHQPPVLADAICCSAAAQWLRGGWPDRRCRAIGPCLAVCRPGERMPRLRVRRVRRGPGHFLAAKAKSVIFLYMDGGPSQVDTFDPKPRLDREHGQPIKVQVAADPVQQRRQRARVALEIPAVRPERHAGQRPVPARGRVRRRPGDHPLDDRRTSPSTPTPIISCTPAAASRAGRAWAPGSTYGLGSECQDLPGFVVLNGGLIPPGGLDCFNSGFLPATYQGSVFKPAPIPWPTSSPTEPSADCSKTQARADAEARPGESLERMGRHDHSRDRPSPTTNSPSACNPPCPS